jgi:hypothetical protein
MSSRRRKNPHPKRAVNARTVLKGEKEEPLVLCSRIPDEDDDFNEANHHQIQKEEEEEKKRERRRDTVRKGAKRKRGHECDVCEKVFVRPSVWPDTCVFTRTRNRTNVMCARSVLRHLVI